MKKLINVLLPLALLSACAINPAPIKIDFCFPPLSPEKGRLFLYRTAPRGFGVLNSMYINNMDVGKLEPHYAHWGDRLPGEYEISVGHPGKNKLVVNISRSEQVFVRFDVDRNIFGKGFYPVLVDKKTGRDQLIEFTGADPDCTR